MEALPLDKDVSRHSAVHCAAARVARSEHGIPVPANDFAHSSPAHKTEGATEQHGARELGDLTDVACMCRTEAVS